MILSVTKLMSEFSFSLKILLIDQLLRIFLHVYVCKGQTGNYSPIRYHIMTHTINKTGAALSPRKAACSTCRTSPTTSLKNKQKNNTHTNTDAPSLVLLL